MEGFFQSPSQRTEAPTPSPMEARVPILPGIPATMQSTTSLPSPSFDDPKDLVTFLNVSCTIEVEVCACACAIAARTASMMFLNSKILDCISASRMFTFKKAPLGCGLF